MRTPEEFWARVTVGAPDECWEWKLATFKSGYGQWWDGATMRGAHRTAYQLTHGEIDGSNQCVCHSCDNRKCCNPNHLWLGTAGDNVRDMFRKGRQRHNPDRGSANVSSKLDEQCVREIHSRLRAGESQRSLAADFGVSQHLISLISRGRSWPHVYEEMSLYAT